MKLPGHNSNHGGSRAGGGRPKQIKNFSDAVKKDFLKAAKQKAQETGRTLGEVVVGLIYDDKIQDSVRLAAIKVWAEVVVVKESRHKIEEQRQGGLIILPAVKPVPPQATVTDSIPGGQAAELKH